MAAPLTHDIRIWLTEAQYAGLLRRAHEDDRPWSAYVRRLIVRALDESLAGQPVRDYARRGSLAGRLP